MAWKKKYQETRRKRAAVDDEYRKKRNAQSIGKSRARYDKYHKQYYKNNLSKWVITPKKKRRRNALRHSKYHTDANHRKRVLELAKKWRADNPERTKAIRLKKYGVTLDQFNQVLKDQNGVCAICGCKHKNKLIFPVLDHCHSSGKFRGILCALCNKALGLFKDDVGRLAKAIKYLERNKRG